jgi:hypothetical protein
VAGDRQDASALADVVGELLERFDVELRLEYVERFDPADVVTPDGSAPPAVARAWIDLAPELIGEEPTQATLFLADASWERLCVRRVPLADGVDEVAREELAHMLASGVEGLLAPGASARLATPSTAYFALVRAGLGLRWRLFGATELLLALVCDVDAEPRSYWAREGEEKVVVLEPWVVRPLATLTLSTDLLALPGPI